MVLIVATFNDSVRHDVYHACVRSRGGGGSRIRHDFHTLSCHGSLRSGVFVSVDRMKE